MIRELWLSMPKQNRFAINKGANDDYIRVRPAQKILKRALLFLGLFDLAAIGADIVRKPSLSGFIALLLLISCQNQNDVSLKIHVSDNQKSPVEGARVLLDNKIFGQTDKNGLITIQNKFPTNSKVKIEIRKESAKNYYAPYFDSIFVNHKDQSSIELSATLYFVPKPSPEDKSAAVEDTVATTKALPEPPTTPAILQATQDPTLPLDQNDAQSPPPTNNPAEALHEDNISPAIADNSIPAIEAVEPDLQATEAMEIVKPQPKKPILFTIYTYNSKVPVASVDIKYGYAEEGIFHKGCRTNKRGRCTIKFNEIPERTLAFYAQKNGYRDTTLSSRITHKGKLRFQLLPGQSLNIHAISTRSRYSRGLPGVEVIVQGETQGQTDDFGNFSYFYTGKPGDLLEITLNSKSHLPHTYSTDFIVSGDMKLTKHFTSELPPKIKLGIFPVGISGEASIENSSAMLATADQLITKSISATLFKTNLFQHTATSITEKIAKEASLSLTELELKGWSKSALEQHLDAMIKPTLILGSNNYLELAILDSKGMTLAAAKTQLDSTSNYQSYIGAMKDLSVNLLKVYPFESAVIKKSDKLLTLNIGSQGGRPISKGSYVEIFGNQSDRYGRSRTYKSIAKAQVVLVSEHETQAEITQLLPRASVSIGDLAIWRPRQKSENKSPKAPLVDKIKVIHRLDNVTTPISQANIYLDSTWLATTDSRGEVPLPTSLSEKGSVIRIVKQGYADFVREIKPQHLKSGDLTFNLQKKYAFVSVETRPAGAVVKLDGRTIGRSPIREAIKTTSGFINLTIDNLPGYKKLVTILELDQGTLDLTGPHALILELDLIEPIENLVNAGKLEDALQKIEAVPFSHSDFVSSQFLAGNIYLTMVNKPDLAAEAFSKVTSQPEIKNFNDKRYINAHINEGIAVFMTGEAHLKANPTVAVAHYQKAYQILAKAKPYLRFIKEDESDAAVANVDYYQALSLHRVYDIKKDKSLLSQVLASWQRYLDGESSRHSDSSNLERGRIYFKQAKAAINQKVEKL